MQDGVIDKGDIAEPLYRFDQMDADGVLLRICRIADIENGIYAVLARATQPRPLGCDSSEAERKALPPM